MRIVELPDDLFDSLRDVFEAGDEPKPRKVKLTRNKRSGKPLSGVKYAREMDDDDPAWEEAAWQMFLAYLDHNAWEARRRPVEMLVEFEVDIQIARKRRKR